MRAYCRPLRVLIALAIGVAAIPASAQTVRTKIYPANSIPASTQTGVTISSATALTIPRTANIALIQAQGSNNTNGVCLFWRDDGTAPTASAGQALAANQTLAYSISGLPLQAIAATGATCTMTVTYYSW